MTATLPTTDLIELWQGNIVTQWFVDSLQERLVAANRAYLTATPDNFQALQERVKLLSEILDLYGNMKSMSATRVSLMEKHNA